MTLIRTLEETVLMRGHKICYCLEIRKIVFELSSVPLLVWSSAALLYSCEYLLVFNSDISLSCSSSPPLYELEFCISVLPPLPFTLSSSPLSVNLSFVYQLVKHSYHAPTPPLTPYQYRAFSVNIVKISV